ncbi:hypothetical protein RSOL_448010 [Rhizoctonia solani AG-3 Rhs1AP]|uniref:Uncharacterized protein n=1 Tax=Rhizoctonia solani AG-3 Rhs1AP TaxID=1086054 RepID=X8JPC1_9AGAM|nr:hypothetical protein RSOL_448010 [Rhizoctonia solani AG-3 Rhs1AP]
MNIAWYAITDLILSTRPDSCNGNGCEQNLKQGCVQGYKRKASPRYTSHDSHPFVEYPSVILPKHGKRCQGSTETATQRKERSGWRCKESTENQRGSKKHYLPDM